MQEEHHEKIRKNKEAMMEKNFIEIIQYHIDNKMILNVERENISESVKITGFPIILTNEYLFMTNIYDFHDEGYVLIKTSDITDAYSTDDESFYESICIKERLQDKIYSSPIKEWVDMKAFIEDIMERRYVTFHCEKESEKCNFYMGKVENTTEDFVELLSLGADGKWDDKTDTLYFSNITMIVIDDYYAKMFYKYSKKK